MTFKNFFLFLFSAAILFSTPACNNDDDMIGIGGMGGDGDFKLSINLSSPSGQFVLVTNSSGEKLFEDIGAEIIQDLSLNIAAGETVDVTFGNELSTSFNITSYNNIQSGFVLDSNIAPCPESPFDANNTTFGEAPRMYEITIENVPAEPVEFYHGFDFSPVKFYDPSDQTLSISGIAASKNDLLFTVRTDADSNPKSLLVEYNSGFDLVDVITINSDYNDWANSTRNEITIEDTSTSDQWIVNATAITSEDRIVNLNRWGNFTGYQTGPTVSVFTTDVMQIDQLKLDISNGRIDDKKEFVDTYNAFPNSIDLYNANVTLDNVTTESVEASVDEGYDFLEGSYTYIIDNFISNWKIYDYNTSGEFNFTRPTLPDNFMTETQLIGPNINQPDRFSLNAYQLKGASLTTINPLETVPNVSCVDFDVSGAFEAF